MSEKPNSGGLLPPPRIDEATAEQTIRDMMGLLALPALWAERDSETILQIMIEAAERIVPLSFIYAQITLSPDQTRSSVLRIDGEYLHDQQMDAWGSAAEVWSSTRIPEGRAFAAATPMQEMRIIRLSLGHGSFGGKIWFGSVREEFPTVSQLAFLRTAASLAATGLHTARASYEREQASRAKDEFLAMLGHELRNPLAPIMTALELLKLRNNGVPLREHQIIERQAKHLSRLVDDLLDVTRITRGKIELRQEPVELKGILMRAIENTNPLLEQRRHALSLDFPDRKIWVLGDETRLTQIFANLLTNAAKYTDAGGKIDLLMRADEHQATVVVRDNGSGISPELFPRLFKIFEQGVATIDRSKGGLGIGLALVKSFVELHGGTVSVSSDGEGCGSAFTVRLPVLKHTLTDPPAPIAERLEPVTPMRVLVVDDNIDALESIRDYLIMRGHKVRAVSDPLDALKTVDDFQPQAAILDIGLPTLDGYRLAMELRKRFAAQDVRLIALTGYGQANDMKQSQQAGFDVHLVKPVVLRDLDAALAGAPLLRGSPVAKP